LLTDISVPHHATISDVPIVTIAILDHPVDFCGDQCVSRGNGTMRRMKAWMRGFGLAVVAGVGLAGQGAAADQAPLRIGMIPDAGATQVAIQEKAPLQKYLSDKLGRPVQLVIPTNYNATVEAIGNGSLDIAYFGGLTYVKAHARYGAVPLVQRDIDQRFHSLFITRSNSGIHGLADLRGKSFCFGDINSTSGHLVPRLILKRAHLPVETALKSFRHTGSHPATAQAVATGACDAGAIDETVFKSLVADGKISASEVVVFYTSPTFSDYVWAARKDLPPQVDRAFSAALMQLQPGRDDAVLKILRAEKYVPAKDAAYATIARLAKELNLL
jgi:phosphonate transport system substrate-binding protein